MGVTPGALLERAQVQSGLSDFGPDGWQGGFERLVAAMGTDVGDDADVTRRIEAIIVGRLVNRLRIEDWYAHHAGEAAAHRVEGPLVVVGTGRSGTTATHYLLAVDPRFRYLRKWEIEDPVPPPSLATEADDPRRPVSVPSTVHHIATVDGPTEDRRILELSFHDDGRTLALPSYVDTWRDVDHSTAFPYHERVLRMLHSHRPPHRWLLKSPDYLFNLPPLFAQYPDIRFVMTHRDPVKVVPSVCSVTIEHTRLRLPDWTCDPAAFGKNFLEHLAEGVRRFLAFRDSLGEDRFVDVGQPELQADPVGVAERIYHFAGLELTDELRIAMDQWSRANRAGSRGDHHYSAEQFGLTDTQIREAFAEYLDRFGGLCAPER
jgi:hypothetical protein